MVNDLKSATRQIPDGSGGWDTVGISYYRYYTASSGTGFPHAMKMRFSPEAYRRMLNDSIDPLTASDNTVKPYADNYFEYGNDGAVTKEIAAVCPSCPGGGTTSDIFEYATNPNNPTHDYGNWQTKTNQTLPDGAKMIVYSNYAGLPILEVYVASNGTDKWMRFYRYADAVQPQVIWQAEASAITGYSESYNDLLNYNSGTGKYQYLRDSDGLIYLTEYYSTTNIGSGQVQGYVSASKVRKGQNTGADILLRTYTYTSHSDSNGSTIYPVSTIVDYPDASNPSTTITTSFAYTWHSGTNQMATRTTTLPSISTGQNGPNSSATIVEQFDIYGNLTQVTDERGTVNQYTYDVVLGVMIQSVLNSSGSTGAGFNVTTDYTYDSDGRLTQVLGPSHSVEISGSATTVRTATWKVYKQSVQPGSGAWGLDEEWTGNGYATGSGPYTYTLVDPVAITRIDKNGRVNDQISSKRTTGSGALAASNTFSQTDWKSWSSTQYDIQGRTSSSRVYHLIPSSGTGSVTTNYGQTDFGYDALERRNKVKSPAGTITRTVWTAPQRVKSVWIGTNDTGATDSNPAGSGSPNNMVKVSENQYDGGSAGGDGNLTQVTQYADGSDTRITTYGYDFRNRQTSMDGEIDVYTAYTYDNLNRLTQTDRKNTSSGGNLIGRSVTNYDDRGRVYQQITYAVDPSTGTPGNALTTNTWFDAGHNIIKQINAGDGIAFSKSIYNGMGWVTATYRGYNTTNNWSTATSLSSDIILEQSANAYDEAGNLISSTSLQRLNDAPASGSGSAGALTTGSNPKGRVSYSASWFGPIDRTISSANYGAASSFSRPSTTPTRSDTVLVTTMSYDDAGRMFSGVDPGGLELRTEFDAAGRKTKTTEAYGTGDARETDFTYTLDNQIATQTAVNSDTGNQTTTYTYGTTLSDSDVASNSLLRSVTYPPGLTWSGLSSDDWSNLTIANWAALRVNADTVTYSYNRLSQQKTMTDQRGTVHSFDYDKLGRLLHDRITTFGNNTDNFIKRISRTYEVRGMLEKITSYDNATVGSGTVKNDVKLEYNTFNQLVKEWQDHSTTVSGSSPKVEYAYAAGGSSSNQIRPTSLTYPNTRVIDYNYGTSSGMDDLLNRISAIKDGSTSLAAYTYLGAGTVIRIDYTEPDVMLDLWGGTTATFAGLDIFNRITNQRWKYYGESSADRDWFVYAYDRDSNRTSKENVVSKALGTPVYMDEQYTYDNLNRLTVMKRGQLSGGSIASPTKEQDWTLDRTGNWSNFMTKTSGSTDLNQTRTHSPVNQINGITESTGPVWVDPRYDEAGNTITMPQVADPTLTFTATYDAWNRMVSVSDTGGTIATYQYDGRGRRVVKVTTSPSETRHFYFTNSWQDIEERTGSSTSADLQYVWGIRYVDELICRDASSTRLYALQDANFNLTSIVSDSGAVQERYAYYPYGQRLIFDANWGARSSSSYNWSIGHQGLLLDPESGLYYNRNRMLHPLLGRFLQRDPMGYADGMNVYEYTKSRPGTLVDPSGEGVLLCLSAKAAGMQGAYCSAALAACRAAPSQYNPACWAAILCIGEAAAECLGRNTRNESCTVLHYRGECTFRRSRVDYGFANQVTGCTCEFDCPGGVRRSYRGELTRTPGPGWSGDRYGCKCPPIIGYNVEETEINVIIDW
jgi:RHS repeat-associated protein